MPEIVEHQKAARLELRRTGIGVRQHGGIGMPGIDIDPVEIAVLKFGDDRIRQAIVTYHPNIGQ
jgi:hypothetical protein